MSEYKKPYLILFDAVIKAIEEIENNNIGLSKQILIQSIKEAEDAYIDFEETDL